MKGLILVNAYIKDPSNLNQAYRLKEEFDLLGVHVDIIRNDNFISIIKGGGIISAIEGYSFCVYLDKDKYISKMLECSGMRLFNRHDSIRACDDKMNTCILLSGQGIRQPVTLPGLLCYDPEEHIKTETVDRIEKELNYPVIVKESFGSLGKGVHKADSRAQLIRVMEELKMRPHLFQECILSSLGRDVRTIVIGGKFRAAMLRKSDNDFRSNIELGGCGFPFSPSQEFISVSEKAAEILNLDYCGVDILFGPSGEPIICEVNSNAFFGGIEKVTGVNVAREYAEHILSVL